MSQQTDPEFLKNEEYRNSKELSKRIEIQETYSTNPEHWFPWVFAHLHLPEKGRILELGSGPGDLWLGKGEQGPDGLQILLTDLSSGMLDSARQRIQSSPGSKYPGQRFIFSAIDAQAIPFPQNSFQTVIGAGLLDHIPERTAALNEIWRVLQPEGRFYTTAGSRTHLQELETLARPFLPDANYGGSPDRFGLENGAILLSPWFRDIHLERFSGDLVFRSARPVLDYLLSEAKTRQALSGDRLVAFRTFVENELAVRGELRVTVEKGLFSGIRREKE